MCFHIKVRTTLWRLRPSQVPVFCFHPFLVNFFHINKHKEKEHRSAERKLKKRSYKPLKIKKIHIFYVSNKEMNQMNYYSICLQISEQRNWKIFGLPSFKIQFPKNMRQLWILENLGFTMFNSSGYSKYMKSGTEACKIISRSGFSILISQVTTSFYVSKPIF